MTGFGWGVRSLTRRPLRTGLSLAGIAVAAAMLLDMVMLSGGIDKSFSELLLARAAALSGRKEEARRYQQEIANLIDKDTPPSQLAPRDALQ